MPNAIEISQLSHAYGKVQALHGVSLAIGRGATVGLIGPDGVGKSTLLSLIAGVRTLQDGEVRVLGHNVAHNGPASPPVTTSTPCSLMAARAW